MQEWCSDWFLSFSAIKQAKETYEKILRQLVFWEGGVISNEKNNPINIRKSLLRGIFLQVAFHDNRPKDTYANMSEQQPGLIAENSVMLDKKAPIIVFVTFSRTKRNYSLNVFAIEADWLFVS